MNFSVIPLSYAVICCYVLYTHNGTKPQGLFKFIGLVFFSFFYILITAQVLGLDSIASLGTPESGKDSAIIKSIVWTIIILPFTLVFTLFLRKRVNTKGFLPVLSSSIKKGLNFSSNTKIKKNTFNTVLVEISDRTRRFGIPLKYDVEKIELGVSKYNLYLSLFETSFGLFAIFWGAIISVFLLPVGLLFITIGLYRVLSNNSFNLNYRLSEKSEEIFDNTESLLAKISISKGSWLYINEELNYSARTKKSRLLIDREETTFKRNKMRFLKHKLPFYCIKAKKESFYFLPDGLMRINGDGGKLLPYKTLEINVANTKYTETKNVPKDAKIIGSTWSSTNIDGSRDKRIKDNRELPIVQYQELSIRNNGDYLCKLAYSNCLSPEDIELFKTQLKYLAKFELAETEIK